MKKLFFTLNIMVFLCLGLQAQITGTVTSTESICLSDGTIKISNPDPTSEYALTGPNIPQLGPFVPMMNMVVFTDLPKGTYTITEFKLDNSAPTQDQVVPGNYEQNWIFQASVSYDPCTAGIPVVEIKNFQILNALLVQQRPPFTYRISTKGGSLSPDGTGLPAFSNVSSFPISYPGGMNGNYELQAKDACGNYKTINIYVPQTAPAPALNLGFDSFKNCAGDAVYNATASGGKPNYVYTIIAPSTDQVGTSKTSAGGVQFDLTSGGTYTIQAMDQCGGISTGTVTVRPYVAPLANVRPGLGSCNPMPDGSGAFSIFASADGIGPYSAVVTNDCGEPIITINPLSIGSTRVSNLKRPCKYTVTVTDACNFTASFMANLVGPGPGKLQALNSITCPTGVSTNYALNIDVDSLPPYNPSFPFTFHVKDNLGNYLPGYPLTMMSSAHSVALPPGDYTYQVTDACGADNAVTPFKILKYEDPTVTVDVTNICFGAGQAIVMGVNKNELSPTTYNYSIAAGPTRVGEGPETDSAPNTGKFSSLESEGNYTFAFNDGCKTVYAAVQIPKYAQPTWEVGFGAICPGSTTSKLEVLNLEPDGFIVGPYRWRIIAENSDIYNTALPFPNSIGQTSPIFVNLPPKDAALNTATYTIQGNDGCKNSYIGTGKIGVLPIEGLILNQTNICPDGRATIRARVTIPLAGGGTYVYFRDGIEVARSTNLFTFINNALPGSYTARVFPNILVNPTCFSETPAAIVVTGTIGLACVPTQPSCTNRSGGSVAAVITNGVSPYTYLWSNGAATESITGLGAGNYSVTIMDKNLCTVSCNTTLIEPIVISEPVVTVANNICPQRTGTITLLQGCGVGSEVQYSSNNGLTWSGAKPFYTQAAKTILARCVYSSDTTCRSSNYSVTTKPVKCLNPGGECTIVASAVLDPCNNNGTNDDSTDDYFTIQLNASVLLGGSSNKFEVVLGADPMTGTGGNVLNSGGTTFGSPAVVGASKIFKADGTSTYQLVVRDLDNNSCFQLIEIDAVGSCSTEPQKSPCFPVPCVPITLNKN